MPQDIHDPAYVAALFDRCSAQYRRYSAVTSFGFVDRWRRHCLNRLVGAQQIGRITQGALGPAPASAPRIIDLMAGTGEAWPHLLAQWPGARITAIDLSHQMHLRAMTHIHGHYANQINHIEANALNHPLPTETADLVIATFGLKTLHADQQRALAAQIATLLRPGGAFALIEASDPKGWALRPLYRVYLDRILPLIERIFLRGAQDFAMIGTYTRAFGDCRIMEQALRDQGLTVTFQSHFFGCATSVAGTRPIAQDGATP